MVKDFNEVWHEFCRKESEISIRYQYERGLAMNKRLLTCNGLAHLLVDAVCAAAVLSAPPEELLRAALIYNSFAFSTQCLVGLVTDRTGHCLRITPFACLWVALAGLLPLPGTAGAAIIGLGNSLFHVSAGTVTLEDAGDKAAPLGLFVAPGALGVFLGKAFPSARLILCALLLACAVALYLEGRRERPAPASKSAAPGSPDKALALCAVLLTLAVAVRAVGGAASGAAGPQSLWLAALPVLLVFLGKSAGGFACDRLGSSKTALVSVPLAALLILLGGRSPAAGAAGQFFLNLSMPITLFLLYRCLPDSPGFAFGLAASALWPGALIGGMLPASGGLRVLLVLLCFGLALFAVLFAERSLSNEKES